MTSAAPVSTDLRRPWATGLRTMAACHWPAQSRSSTYVPRPRRNRRSSTRSIGLPMKVLTGLIALLHLDPRIPDHLAPTHEFLPHPHETVFGRARERIETQRLQALLRFRQSHDFRDFPIKQIDDRFGRGTWR